MVETETWQVAGVEETSNGRAGIRGPGEGAGSAGPRGVYALFGVRRSEAVAEGGRGVASLSYVSSNLSTSPSLRPPPSPSFPPPPLIVLLICALLRSCESPCAIQCQCARHLLHPVTRVFIRPPFCHLGPDPVPRPPRAALSRSSALPSLVSLPVAYATPLPLLRSRALSVASR